MQKEQSEVHKPLAKQTAEVKRRLMSEPSSVRQWLMTAPQRLEVSPRTIFRSVETVFAGVLWLLALACQDAYPEKT